MNGLLSFVAASPGLVTFVAGGCAGAVSRTLTAPLDRLKVLAQEGRAAQLTMLHPTVQRKAKDSSDIDRMKRLIRHIYRTEGGLSAFWRGNGVNCLKAGPEFALAFSAREFYIAKMCKDPKKPRFTEQFCVGALGGFTAQSVLYPMEVVKTRMAVGACSEYSGILDCISQALHRGGVRDLYKGYFANMAGIIPHRGIEMGMFFSLEQFCGADCSFAALTAISFTSSMGAQILTYPLNLVRTKLQTQGVNGRPRLYNGLADCITKIIRNDGFAGLFSGILPNMLKAVPASMTMYLVFHSAKKQLQSYHKPATQ